MNKSASAAQKEHNRLYRTRQVRMLTATLEQDEITHKRESQHFDSLSVSAPVQTPYSHRAGS